MSSLELCTSRAEGGLLAFEVSLSLLSPASVGLCVSSFDCHCPGWQWEGCIAAVSGPSLLQWRNLQSALSASGHRELGRFGRAESCYVPNRLWDNLATVMRQCCKTNATYQGMPVRRAEAIRVLLATGSRTNCPILMLTRNLPVQRWLGPF